ncbi:MULTISPECIES: hypothetical protein [unclassified Bradyrhizobium]|uniref:hypothetical protein n=1 Tax=unclassified Bradyrhizobium TaxID=2631580 RepID=UPI0028E98E1F|nr:MULTISPECIES: hypothetical protein [unclassified Bradyrhizobium]
MTIRFDPDLRRSTHVESGLAVQWVRDAPPMERSTHFKLLVGGVEVPFTASYDYGEDKIKKANPDIGAIELDRLSTALWEKNYRAIDIEANFDKQIFVEVWQDLVLQGHSSYRISTYYTAIRTPHATEKNEWKCQG